VYDDVDGGVFLTIESVAGLVPRSTLNELIGEFGFGTSVQSTETAVPSTAMVQTGVGGGGIAGGGVCPQNWD